MLLDDEDASDQFVRVLQLVAQARIPRDAAKALGLGRLIALRKPNGRIRGIIVGDLTRRLVARVFAQQKAEALQVACRPFQFALSTRAGAESVVHFLAAALELNPEATIVSVDGIGAFDTMSRQCMLQGLLGVPGANECLPFVRMFYSEPSEYVLHDSGGVPHIVQQAEGGEQGDPLMPALYALGQHPALQAAHNHLREETLVAFLDDVYAVVHRPDRVGHVHGTLARQLEAHCHVRLNEGKTRVWNAAGQVPRDLGQPGMPDLSCWVGAGPLPDAEQGLTVLGVPFGSAAFVRTQLQVSRAGHDQLLQRLPELDDLQASWLLLLFGCSPRCNSLLRMLPPSVTAEYAGAHDSAVLSTFADFLGVDGLPDRARRIAQLPLSLGGLGLVSAVQTSVSAYWASWADCLPVLGQHLPPAAQAFLRDLEAPAPHVPCLRAAATTRAELSLADWTPPSWRELCDGVPAPTLQEDGPSTFVRGWQGAAASAVARRQCEQLLSTLDPSSEALLRSQQGPFASRFLTTPVPTCPALSYPSHLFRVLLLRRLRLPLPLSQRYSRCRRPLDSLGDHRAACARAGVLQSRGCPLERAAARVCREAGARVTCNTISRSIVSTTGGLRSLPTACRCGAGSSSPWTPRWYLPCPARGSPAAGVVVFKAPPLPLHAAAKSGHTRSCSARSAAAWLSWPSRSGAGGVTRQPPLCAPSREPRRERCRRLRSSLVAVLVARWSALLSHAAMSAFAATFTQRAGALSHADGALPPLGELFADAGEAPLTASRLPAG